MSEAKIRVLIAEDHHVVRRALRNHLDRDPLLEVVGEVAEGSTLLKAVAQYQPDVLLMDLKMPDHHPVEAVSQIREQHPAVKIVVLSAHKTPEHVVGLFQAAIDGYVVKDDAADSPIQAIHQVMQGEKWVSPQAASVLAAHVHNTAQLEGATLTDREVEVLGLVAIGYRNEQIAEELVISEHTVRNHISNIFQKLNVETRVEAVIYALSVGLISFLQVTEAVRRRSGHG